MHGKKWMSVAVGICVMAAAAIMTVGILSAASAGSRWGADYFPNVPLITHDGKTVRFYDDLLKGKIVAIYLMSLASKLAV